MSAKIIVLFLQFMYLEMIRSTFLEGGDLPELIYGFFGEKKTSNFVFPSSTKKVHTCKCIQFTKQFNDSDDDRRDGYHSFAMWFQVSAT